MSDQVHVNLLKGRKLILTRAIIPANVSGNSTQILFSNQSILSASFYCVYVICIWQRAKTEVNTREESFLLFFSFTRSCISFTLLRKKNSFDILYDKPSSEEKKVWEKYWRRKRDKKRRMKTFNGEDLGKAGEVKWICKGGYMYI